MHVTHAKIASNFFFSAMYLQLIFFPLIWVPIRLKGFGFSSNIMDHVQNNENDCQKSRKENFPAKSN